MATTSAYPVVTPKVEDLILGTQADPALGNPTSNFTIESIVSLVESNLGVNKIIAGQGLTISPSNGKGDVTISAPTASQWLTSDAVVTNGVVNYISNLLIPTGATTVGESAFSSMNIDAVDFNNQAITSIGRRAFAANKLKGTLTLPTTLLTIDNEAFQTPNSIELIEFGNQLTSIGDNAFRTNSLTSINIPSSVTAIGDNTFMQQEDSLGTRTLTSLTFEPRTTALTLGSGSFMSNAITSVSIPANTVVGEQGFSSNTGMTSAVINDNCTIDQRAFAYNGDMSSLTIGSNVEIGYSAFGLNSNTPNVMTSVNIPSTTTLTGYTHFANRSSLTSFTVDNGATSFWPQTLNSGVIPNSIFLDCGLTEVSIDSNVTIGGYAFQGNPLTSISIGENVTLETSCFARNGAVISILTIPGTTIFPSGSHSQFSGSSIGSITNLIIEEGITEIPNSFASSSRVTNVTFPSSLVVINDFSFFNNNISGTLTFASVISIGYRAFWSSPGITTVNVPIGSTLSSAAFDAGVTINYV